MTRLILVAAAGLLLATASAPPPKAETKPEGELTSVVAAEAPAGAATSHKAHKPHKPAPMASAAETGAYPRCSATVRDRCTQGRYRAAPARHREVQYAMRAGERG